LHGHNVGPEDKTVSLAAWRVACGMVLGHSVATGVVSKLNLITTCLAFHFDCWVNFYMS